MEKKDLLKETVKHIDIKKYDSTELIDAMRHMSFTSRDTARAADILCQMLAEKDCTNILTIAGSTSAAGCMQVYVDMVRNKMIDAVVSTGASIIDMDLFEALGYKHYIGTKENVIPDTKLRELYIDRIYDTFIDEEELQACDQATCDVADLLEPRPYSSREFLYNVGKWLAEGHGVSGNCHFSIVHKPEKLLKLGFLRNAVIARRKAPRPRHGIYAYIEGASAQFAEAQSRGDKLRSLL